MAKTGQKAIHLLIVDDHALFRESVARLLQAEPGFDVVAHCATATEALRILNSSPQINIVLLDLDLGKEKGADFVEGLHARKFEGKTLLVTAGVNDSELPNLIRKGIAGVFLKHGSPASLIQGIRDIADGKTLFASDMLRRAFAQSEVISNESDRAELTDRERRVLSFVFEGLANKQIADKLAISESAVKAILQRLFAKTGVRTRSQLVRVALETYRGKF
jgi:two-component system nitrate/nitrite response regulator NarL